jgi:ABC-type nitrate/sulfonate/bicarbonate transport system permease component
MYLVKNPLFFTGPIEVAKGIRDMWVQGTLGNDLIVSAQEFAIGFGLSLVAGILLGMALGTSNALKGYLDPLINA